MDKLPSKDIPPTSDVVREWDPTEQKIVTTDRGTHFLDKYLAADRFATKATGLALVFGMVVLLLIGALSNAWSTARHACSIVDAVWNEREAAGDDDKPQWMLSRDVDIDTAFSACKGYIE
jgi:hypothetical protein